jgi:putative hydrolase of the HAD superfamily
MMKAALFDYGGTLVTSVGNDIMPLVVEGAKHAHAYLQRISPDASNFNTFYQAATNALQSAFMAIMGTPSELKAGEVLDELLSDLDIFPTKEQFAEFTREWFKPFKQKTVLLDGAKECLQALKNRGMKLAIVSNTIWPQYIIDEEMKRLRIDGFFDCVVTSYAFGTKKPYPEIFEHTLTKLGVEAAGAVFVGDSLKEDVAGASMVGMKTVLLDWKREEMPGVTADAKISALSELAGVIAKL